MDTWERFMKYLLFTVNVVILIFAILVIIVSLYGLVKEGYFIFIICALIGILMMSVAILGIVAAMRKSKCMLLTYAIIAIVLAPLIMIEMIGHPFQHSTEIAIIATLIGLLIRENKIWYENGPLQMFHVIFPNRYKFQSLVVGIIIMSIALFRIIVALREVKYMLKTNVTACSLYCIDNQEAEYLEHCHKQMHSSL